jgi:hypothetical protein
MHCDNNTFAECTANNLDQGSLRGEEQVFQQGGAGGLVHTLPYKSGSRQFTVTLSDDEIASLCNCQTEPTQPPDPVDPCRYSKVDCAKYPNNECCRNVGNCANVDCRTAYNSPCCVIIDPPPPEQNPLDLSWLTGFRHDLWQYWFDMGAETCKKGIGIEITRGKAFSEIAKRWDLYGKQNLINRLPDTMTNRHIKELVNFNMTTESLGKVESSGVINGEIFAGCHLDQDSVKFAMTHKWDLEPLSLPQQLPTR